MYTVITKGNEVSQHISIDSIERSVEGPFLAIGNCNGTKVAFTEDNPINWPADATNGMQAIVDVKAGTLRFAYDGWPRAQTEFVVSNYVEDSAPHIFDVINYWPQQDRQCLGTKDLPEGWMWQWAGNDWVLSNGTIGLVRDDWFKYRNKMVEAQQVSAQPTQVTAASILTAALGHMEDRAKTYDAPGGERSMGKTVAAFNVITGHTLTEEAGWLFMEILKQVRSQQGDYRADSYEDLVAYAALRGECAARERGNKS